MRTSASVKARSANATATCSTCEKITGDNAYQTPMRIYPAVHYTMGGLWVDYNLMSNLPGLFVIGEANFSDHGANRLGASALMQGLADGYFILPYTVSNFFASTKQFKPATSHPDFKRVEEEINSHIQKLLSIRGKRTVTSFHRELGKLLWDKCGMTRNEAGLKEALQRIPALRQEFWENVTVTGESGELNQELEQAGRVADYMEFAELLCLDALTRRESCGGHFRTEFQTEDGEALRDDQNFAFVSAWEFQGDGKPPTLHKEPLVYEEMKMSQRSYK
jgi:succinate dehydrogenase / fumarate reductase flavoprotein subunit